MLPKFKKLFEMTVADVIPSPDIGNETGLDLQGDENYAKGDARTPDVLGPANRRNRKPKQKRNKKTA
jgi:hypothetical protein